MGRSAVGASLALALCATPPAAGGETLSHEPWEAQLQPNGWTLIDNNETAVIFAYLPAEAVGAYQRVWTRFEARSPRTAPGGALAFLSFEDLEEVDCVQDRIRTIQATYYAGRNLSGAAHPIGAGVTFDWISALPNSFTEAIVRTACPPG